MLHLKVFLKYLIVLYIFHNIVIFGIQNKTSGYHFYHIKINFKSTPVPSFSNNML